MMTNAEIIEQIQRHEREKAAYLNRFVIHYDPPGRIIQWAMWSQAPDGGFGLGHGVHYHDCVRPSDADVVALIRGFRWQRRDEDAIIQGYYLQPDHITTPDIIAELKQKIEALVAARERHYYPQTWITERIYARGNC